MNRPLDVQVADGAQLPVGPIAVRFERLQPDLAQVARGLGLDRERPAHRRWFETVDELSAGLPRILRPRGLFRVDAVRRLDRFELELASGATFAGAVGQFLQHSTAVATFIVTIGSALERLSRGWLRAGQVMRGAIADALASECAEATAEKMQEEVRRWAVARGLDITPRYSPGYCGMNVRQQIPLFGLLPARRINVHLKPSCLMVPVKSVSGLIGLGPAEKVSPAGYPCQFCDHPTCMQRRVPLDRNQGACHDWGDPAAGCPTPT